VAFGDSHMGMWLPALDDIGRAEGIRVVPLVKWACPSYDVAVRSLQHPGSYTECDDFRAWATDQIEALQPDLVVLTNRGMPGGMLADPDEQAAAWGDGVAKTVIAMRERARRVVVLGDVPRVGVDPADCLSALDATVADCTIPEAERSNEANRATEQATRTSGGRYVDMVPFVCAGGACPLAVDQTVTYRDDDHLSVTWAHRIAPDLGRLLELPAMLPR
jgi:hypothetical protein